MRNVFTWLGGRRHLVVWVVGVVSLSAETFLSPEAAARAIEAITWIGGLFIGGESLADAAGRFGKK